MSHDNCVITLWRASWRVDQSDTARRLAASAIGRQRRPDSKQHSGCSSSVARRITGEDPRDWSDAEPQMGFLPFGCFGILALQQLTTRLLHS